MVLKKEMYGYSIVLVEVNWISCFNFDCCVGQLVLWSHWSAPNASESLGNGVPVKVACNNYDGNDDVQKPR